MSVKIATWNVNSLRVRLAHVLDWLERHQPDIFVLQETKVQDHEFPVSDFTTLNYHTIFKGQKTFNGVAILSRQPATNVITQLPNFEDTQCRLLCATIQAIRVINIYAPNGQSIGSDKYHYKLSWLNALYDFVQQELKQHANLVILGDFNIAPEDRDVHDPAIWTDSVLVSPAERQALNKIMQLGFEDLFRRFESATNHFSWWDYRGGQFWKNAGLRIDLILANQAYAKQCQNCEIDTRPRKLKRPSDHAPVLATFC